MPFVAPVPAAPVVQAFHYDARRPFRRGWHRGVTFAVRPGAAVRAPCAGVVEAVPRWRVVVVHCGGLRVSLLPVAAHPRTIRGPRADGRAGSTAVARGATIATAASRRLHLGVRSAGDRFDYRDPASLLALPPLGRAPRGPIAVRRPDRRGTPPSRIPRAGPQLEPFVPWPVLLGLAAVLGGLGGGTRLHAARRRRSRASVQGRGARHPLRAHR